MSQNNPRRPTFDPARAMAQTKHEFGEHGGVNMSVEASTTFTVMDADTMPDIFAGEKGPVQGGCYLYGRHFNPTVFALGRSLAAMENTAAGYACASGLAAISAAVMQICDTGDHCVVSDTIYGGTYALFRDFLPLKTGITCTFVDANDADAVRAAMRPDTKLVYTETMANPTLKVPELATLAEIAHSVGAKLVVDNTFCPMMVTPANHGADVVVHSLTKFVNGASDIIAGAVCASEEFIQQLMDLHTGALMILGPTMDPTVAFHIAMRLPHLGVRMAEHSRRAQLFAERLEDLGVPVHYPGLESHPNHARLKAMLNPGYGFGGLLALDLGTESRAQEFMERLQNKHAFGFMAVSLGYFDTLMSCSGSSTSSEMTDEDKTRAGISPGLVRMSLGLTGNVEDRWQQLAETLDTLNMLGSKPRTQAG